MRNINANIDSSYVCDEESWVTVAGRVIKAVAEEEYKAEQEIEEIKKMKEDCLYKIRDNVKAEIIPEIIPLLREEVSIYAVNKQLDELKEEGCAIGFKYIKKYKDYQYQEKKLEGKLNDYNKFFNGNFFHDISMGLTKEYVREGVRKNMEKGKLWRDISIRKGLYRVNFKRNKKIALSNAGYETEKFFDTLEEAIEYRDKLEQIHEKIAN